jgi:hypothetical protein
MRKSVLLIVAVFLTIPLRAFASSGCSLSEARRVVDLRDAKDFAPIRRSRGLPPLPLPQKPDTPGDVICADFARFALMLVLNGTPPDTEWTVYQQANGHWRYVYDLDAPGKPGSVKVLDNGDLLEDTGLGFSTQRRWNGRRFKVVAVSPPPDASRCSILQAQKLAALDQSRIPYQSIDQSFVTCADFPRYGVMLFIDDAGSGGYSVATYQKVANRWQKVQEFDLDNLEQFQVSNNGDLVEQGDWEQRIWRWNGSRFLVIRQSRMVSYWNGTQFEPTEVSDGDRRPGLRGCSIRDARAALLANRALLKRMSLDPDQGLLSTTVGRPPYLGRLICHDFTGSGEVEMAFDLPRAQCDACDPWFIFRYSLQTGWQLLTAADDVMCLLPGMDHGVTVVRATNPQTDLGMAPGIVRQEAHWNGKRFAITKSEYISHNADCHEPNFGGKDRIGPP